MKRNNKLGFLIVGLLLIAGGTLFQLGFFPFSQFHSSSISLAVRGKDYKYEKEKADGYISETWTSEKDKIVIGMATFHTKSEADIYWDKTVSSSSSSEIKKTDLIFTRTASADGNFFGTQIYMFVAQRGKKIMVVVGMGTTKDEFGFTLLKLGFLYY